MIYMSDKGFMIFVIIIVSLHFINQFNAKRKTRERAMVSTVSPILNGQLQD